MKNESTPDKNDGQNHFDRTFLSKWNNTKNHFPFVIAGPCSAESEEQVIETAKALKKIHHVQMFRAGIWKPRTRPNAFEGMGVEALPWLKRVKAETGLPTAVEVATPQHIEQCQKYGVDAIWIGARTTASPFAIQELANALRGSEQLIMLKNPINAELSLWIGALERFYGQNIKNLVAIHRGFSGQENNIFRNLPVWEVPLSLKRHFPELPIICDPSHISGKRDLIARVCQMSMDMDFDGLIIEVHPNPDKALSDSSQQITPEQLNEVLSNLHIKKETSVVMSYEEALEKERAKIDRIDSELIELLMARMSVVKNIGKIKAQHQVTALQVNRMDKLMKDRCDYAKKIGLSPDYIEKIFHQIHDESVRIQCEIMNKKND